MRKCKVTRGGVEVQVFRSRWSRTCAAALLGAALLAGCASPGGAPDDPARAVGALGVADVVQMLRAGRPQPDIAAMLAARGMRTAPAPADLDVLAAAGAGPELQAAVRNAAIVPDAAPRVVVTEPYPSWFGYAPWYPAWGGIGWGLHGGFFSGSIGWGWGLYPPAPLIVRPDRPPSAGGGAPPPPAPAIPSTKPVPRPSVIPDKGAR